MTVIKNFLPENTDKKIYAVMSLDYFREVTKVLLLLMAMIKTALKMYLFLFKN